MTKNTPKDWNKIAEEHKDDLFDDDFAEEQLTEPTKTAPNSGNGVLDHPSYKALEDKLTTAEQNAHIQWEKATRALAEVENLRRRTKQEIDNAYKFNLQEIISSLLPVIDSLEQALQISLEGNESVHSMKQGIELTLKLFVDVLNKFNVSQLDPVGTQFDPQLHEAMTMQYNPEAVPGSVLVVLQKGYLLNDRVIRPARVIVAKEQP